MSDTQPNKLSKVAPIARPSVVQLAIKEKAALYAAYIPLFSEGGMFIPTARDYKLGDAAGRHAALPGGRQGRMDHTGKSGGQPHARGRCSLPV